MNSMNRLKILKMELENAQSLRNFPEGYNLPKLQENAISQCNTSIYPKGIWRILHFGTFTPPVCLAAVSNQNFKATGFPRRAGHGKTRGYRFLGDLKGKTRRSRWV